MKVTYDNLVLSSFSLWLDHEVVKRGEAYSNTNSYLYLSQTRYNGAYTYASPYGQFISDSSLSGPTIMTGLYLNNNFIGTGTSGLLAIDYEKGRAYFNSNVGTNVSGVFSIKDFNIYQTSEPESKLLFETQTPLRPKLGKPATGLFNDEKCYPCIYVKKETSNVKGFELGGTKVKNYTIKLIVFSDSQFKIDALESICTDLMESSLPLFNQEDMPYNVYGGLKSGYNYDQLSSGKLELGSGLYIRNVYSTKLSQSSDLQDINKEAHKAMICFDVEGVRA